MKQFEGINFKGTFRSYQQRVLDNVEQYLADGKINIVAAPGSGKTILGLELVRRLGEPCLILSPTTAIREQWGQRFKDRFLDEQERFEEWFSTDLHKVKRINSITYQALYSVMEKLPDDEEDRDYSDVDIRTILEKHRIKTICLDEAHHLKNEWHKALEKFMNLLDDDVTIISLTATPPYDSEATEWKRYHELCGEIDEEIFVPELVAQDTLCPHQDYIYFNYPTKEEQREFGEYRKRGTVAIDAIGKLECIHTLGETISQMTQDAVFAAPKEYIALLILLNHYGIKTETKLIKALTGSKKLPSLELKYAEVALQFIISEEFPFLKKEQKEEVLRILKENQIYHKKKVSLVMNESLRRNLISSVGKLKSIEQIARNEYAVMGSELRMLVLTDYIKKESLKNIATEESFSSVNVVSIFETIRRSDDNVQIGVLSGSLVILPNCIKLEGIKHQKQEIPGTRYCVVEFAGSTHAAVEFVGDLFEKGEIQILVGTKSLLGEGWDAPCVNSLILASFVGSFVLSNQMRGRAIRIDRNNPHKTANIWHLVTLEPFHVVAESSAERMMAQMYESSLKMYMLSYDFEVLERRFDSFMGPNYETGRIESGIGRITYIEAPFDKKKIKNLNQKMLDKSADREAMRKQWEQEVGNDKFSVEVANELPKEKMVPPFMYIDWFWYGLLTMLPMCISGIIGRSILIALSATRESGAELNGMQIITSVLILLILLGMLSFVIYKLMSKLILHITPTRSFITVGKAVADSLRECGLIAPGANVEVEKNYIYQDEVGFVLMLRNASMHDKNIFNTAITELLSPIENPRYLIVKKNLFGEPVYRYSFACPTILGRKKEHVEVLAKNLNASLGKTEAVYAHSSEGRMLILKCRRKSYISRNERQQPRNVSPNHRKYILSKWE